MQAFSLVVWHGRSCVTFTTAAISLVHTWAHVGPWAHLGTLGHTWAFVQTHARRACKRNTDRSTDTLTDTQRAQLFMRAHLGTLGPMGTLGHTWAHLGTLGHTCTHACKSNTGRQTLTLRDTHAPPRRQIFSSADEIGVLSRLRAPKYQGLRRRFRPTSLSFCTPPSRRYTYPSFPSP